jgi:hypothetical protein
MSSEAIAEPVDGPDMAASQTATGRDTVTGPLW